MFGAKRCMRRERGKHPGMVVADEHCIIRDKFPKARLHGLVVARDPVLQGPTELRQHHLPLLQTMQVWCSRLIDLLQSAVTPIYVTSLATCRSLSCGGSSSM